MDWLGDALRLMPVGAATCVHNCACIRQWPICCVPHIIATLANSKTDNNSYRSPWAWRKSAIFDKASFSDTLCVSNGVPPLNWFGRFILWQERRFQRSRMNRPDDFLLRPTICATFLLPVTENLDFHPTRSVPMETQAVEAALKPSSQSFSMPAPPTFATVEEERLHRKQRLAAAFRLFAKFGFDEGVADTLRLATRKAGSFLG
ncbi:MAG: hypothetical protein U0X75_11695 [Acidobacteriota bacterium]